VFGNVHHGVEAEQAGEQVGAERQPAALCQPLVDQLDREALGLLFAPDLRDSGVENAVDDEAGRLGADDRLLADRLRERHRRGERLLGGVIPFDHLDQRQHGGGIEVVEADDLVGAQRRFGDLGDRQRGGVGGEDRVPGRGRVELGEHHVLDLHPLGNSLDHEVHVAEARVGGGALDAPDDLRDLRLALLSGELAPLHEFADLPGGDVAGLVDPSLHEPLADVLEHDGEAGGGDRLRDLAPHRPCANNRCLEHEHAASSSPARDRFSSYSDAGA
jgi:hypothetical protein